MRAWMKERKRPFSSTRLCDAFDLHGRDREQAIKSIRDFQRRGEITVAPAKQNRRQTEYRYNRTWKRKEKASELDAKIYKAMYISDSFAVTDIQRLAEIPDRDWIDKIVRRLVKGGHLAVVSRRRCAHGAGAEAIYHIPNRDKFRIEVIK